jgi:hypothetical protein
MDGRDALAAVGGAVEVGHAHAAEADGRNRGAGGTEFALFHDNSPRSGGGDAANDEADMRLFDCSNKIDNLE